MRTAEVRQGRKNERRRTKRAPGGWRARPRSARVVARARDVQRDELRDEPRQVQVEHADGAAPGDARDLGRAEPRVFRVVVPQQRGLAEVAFGGHAGCERAVRERTKESVYPVVRASRVRRAARVRAAGARRRRRESGPRRSATASRGFRRPRLGSTESRHLRTRDEATLGNPGSETHAFFGASLGYFERAPVGHQINKRGTQTRGTCDTDRD